MCQDGRTLCRNDAKREKAKKTCGFTVSMSVNSSRVKCENEKIRGDSKTKMWDVRILEDRKTERGMKTW